MHPICPKAGAKNNLPEKIVGQVASCTLDAMLFRRISLLRVHVTERFCNPCGNAGVVERKVNVCVK